MEGQAKSIVIEIPSNLVQREVWDMEEQLQRIEGVEIDLQESKDVVATTLLVLHFAISVIGPLASISEGIKSIHDVAAIIYAFLHKGGKEKASEESKKRIVITKKGKKVEIYNLSVEDIEKLLKDI